MSGEYITLVVPIFWPPTLNNPRYMPVGAMGCGLDIRGWQVCEIQITPVRRRVNWLSHGLVYPNERQANAAATKMRRLRKAWLKKQSRRKGIPA